MSYARNISKLIPSSTGKLNVESVQLVPASSIIGTLNHSNMISGQTLQVVSTLYQSYNSMSITGSWSNVPNMEVTITPRFANSKIRIDVRWFGEVSSAWDVTFGISRNGTAINLPTQEASRYGCLGMPNQSYVQDDNDSTPEFSFYSTIDSPNTTSPVTYRMIARSYSDTRTMWNGRVFSSASTGNYEQGSSEIIVTEYAG